MPRWTSTVLAPLALLALGGCGSSSPKSSASSSAVSIRIVAPADGVRTSADRTAVRGTVIPSDATVQVQGQTAQVGNGVFTASVALHPGANTIDVTASAAGQAPATATIAVIRDVATPAAPKKKHKPAPQAQPQSTGGAPAVFASASNCGGGLTAGARTSCAFAQNVQDSYRQTGSGVLDVYSPVTGQTYRMYCTAGATHVCTGGNNASVYFGDVSGYNTGTCGNGLSVGPSTSCAFAVSVRDAYASSGSAVVRAYSSTTGQSYTMYCTGTSPHVCTGGNNAAVYFP
jgi:hypothetical protein